MTEKARIVVLGGAGMLGHKMFQILRGHFHGVLCTSRHDKNQKPFNQIELLHGEEVVAGIDVDRFEDLSDLLCRLQPRFVVNCVGIIKQRAEATCPIPSILINALLPHRLSELLAGWNGRVIHFSTDCVFNGRKGAYSELDPSDAEDLYGRTKFLGETAAANALTLRTSIIGRELVGHRSLLDWFLSQNGKRVRGFRKAIYSGVTTNHLAEAVAHIVANEPALCGLYQVASEPISKFDLLHLLRDAYSLNIEIEADDIEKCDRSMVDTKFRNATGFTCPNWTELVRRLAADPTPYDKWLST